ncbi:MAG: FTR1 family protein [Thermosynechococcaceae cyanobacterium]
MDISLALPTFVITLREGVEAALVVGIVLTLLEKAKQTHLRGWVYGGVLAGLGVSLLVGSGLSALLQQLQTSEQPWATLLLPFLKLFFSLLTIAMLTWMLVWMTRQARSAKAQIEGATLQALQTEGQAAWNIWILVFIAVLREGLETALFIVAQLQQGWMPMVGAIAGLMGATGIGWALFALGLRINLQRFFLGMGLFVLLIVGGLAISASKQLDLALSTLNPFLPQSFCGTGPSCLLGPLLWDAHQVLPDEQFPGLLLKIVLGYRDRLFWGQAVAYLCFLSVAGPLYWQSLQPSQISVSAPPRLTASAPQGSKESP